MDLALVCIHSTLTPSLPREDRKYLDRCVDVQMSAFTTLSASFLYVDVWPHTSKCVVRHYGPVVEIDGDEWGDEDEGDSEYEAWIINHSESRGCVRDFWWAESALFSIMQQTPQ